LRKKEEKTQQGETGDVICVMLCSHYVCEYSLSCK